MKKITVIVVSMLLAANTFGGQALSSFSSIREQVRNRLNLSASSTSYLSDSTINGHIRTGIIEVNPLLRGVKGTNTFVTTLNQNTYSLDSLAIGVVAAEWSYNDTVKALNYVPRARWYELETKTTRVGKDGWGSRPSAYDYTYSQIILYPTPTKSGDTIKVTSWKRITGMDTLTTLSAMPEAYREAVLNYVVWQVALSKQHPTAPIRKEEYERSLVNLGAAFEGSMVENKPK